jgi:4'-phosphopantetheinyl transferase
MILILYTQIGEELSSRAWELCLSEMPLPMRTRISRYVRWQDRQAGLFGYLLLSQGLVRYGYPRDYLHRLVWDASGRPFLDVRLDFNISHSGAYAVCALDTEGRVGIDIEEMRQIDIYDFRGQMTAGQWQAIIASENRLAEFFSLWTKKEAVIKADGRGLSIPLDAIITEGEEAFVSGEVWELREVKIADGYCCHLATTGDDPELSLEEVSFQPLIEALHA